MIFPAIAFEESGVGVLVGLESRVQIHRAGVVIRIDGGDYEIIRSVRPEFKH